MEEKVIHAFAMGVNIVAFEKLGKKYGMTFAWGTMADHDKVMFLIGSQSVTGSKIEKNDVIGISALGINQKDIGDMFGSHHSDKYDKFKNVKYTQKGTAITIDGVAREMVATVIDVLHFPDNSSDYLIYAKVTEYKEGNQKLLLYVE